MFVRMYSNQLKAHWDIINTTIERSIPNCNETMKTCLIKDLMIDLALCWIYFSDDDKIKGVVITRITEDYALGQRMLTIIASYAPEGTNDELFLNGFNVLKKYGQSHECVKLDFYTTDETIIKYAKMFDVSWQSQYFQLNFS